jgi:predicted Zn-dependent peptidase
MFELYFGDPGRLNSELDRLRAVTVDQIRAFARERLGQDNRVVLTYEPRRGPRPEQKVSR